jgi:hypothetical protein
MVRVASVPIAWSASGDSPMPASLRQAVGGVGLVAVVAIALAVPLVIAVRGAARRRREARRSPAARHVDAWSESARRLKEPG